MRKPIKGFTRQKIVLPVIHLPYGIKGGMRSIDTAVAVGADGVFLINQGMDKETMMGPMLTTANGNYPDLWVGANVLGDSPPDVINKYKYRLNGVWSDNAGVDSLNFKTNIRAMNDTIKASTTDSGQMWKGVYFGGVAFKTQPHIPTNLFKRLVYMSHHIDVITTSGPATGVAPDLDRIKALRSAIGPDRHLAIASGITPENVSMYLPYVDTFLVASGIESEFGVLNRQKTRDLVDVVHGYCEPKSKAETTITYVSYRVEDGLTLWDDQDGNTWVRIHHPGIGVTYMYRWNAESDFYLE